MLLVRSCGAADITLDAFTGSTGARERAWRGRSIDGGIEIHTTRPLAPREGLTLVMGWPRGVVDAPGPGQRLAWLLADNFGLLVALLALAGSAIYLFAMWSRHGRDPARGVIFPHYEPPAEYSPASARYIRRMGYDNRVFAAAVLNLAVKGHLDISCREQEYTLTRKSSQAPLAPGEQALLRRLFADGDSLRLDNANHVAVGAARSAHKLALERDYRGRYFKTNGILLLPSFVPSVLLFGLLIAIARMVPGALAVFALILLLHLLFLRLMRAPSPHGRRLMDKLEGFRQYLDVAERDDLALRNPPQKTPELFERYLPYALALGVEQAWAEQFSEVFARMGEQAGYQPQWYHGNFQRANMAGFARDVGSSLSSAISSAASPPGSSSGAGGGGFSGGGGGGGGGGGW